MSDVGNVLNGRISSDTLKNVGDIAGDVVDSVDKVDRNIDKILK